MEIFGFPLNAGLSVVHPNRANHEHAACVRPYRECPGRWQPSRLQGTVRIPSTQRRLVIGLFALCLVVPTGFVSADRLTALITPGVSQ